MPHKDPEARRSWAKKWYNENKEKVKTWPSRKASVKKYRKDHPDRCRAYSKKYYKENRDKLIIKVRKYWTEKGNERARKELNEYLDSIEFNF